MIRQQLALLEEHRKFLLELQVQVHKIPQVHHRQVQEVCHMIQRVHRLALRDHRLCLSQDQKGHHMIVVVHMRGCD